MYIVMFIDALLSYSKHNKNNYADQLLSLYFLVQGRDVL